MGSRLAEVNILNCSGYYQIDPHTQGKPSRLAKRQRAHALEELPDLSGLADLRGHTHRRSSSTSPSSSGGTPRWPASSGRTSSVVLLHRRVSEAGPAEQAQAQHQEVQAHPSSLCEGSAHWAMGESGLDCKSSTTTTSPGWTLNRPHTGTGELVRVLATASRRRRRCGCRSRRQAGPNKCVFRGGVKMGALGFPPADLGALGFVSRNNGCAGFPPARMGALCFPFPPQEWVR
jgi:hypothetical protein